MSDIVEWLDQFTINSDMTGLISGRAKAEIERLRAALAEYAEMRKLVHPGIPFTIERDGIVTVGTEEDRIEFYKENAARSMRERIKAAYIEDGGPGWMARVDALPLIEDKP